MSNEPDQIPALGDVMDFPSEPRDDDKRWLVLFPDDYHRFGRDPEGNLAVLVDHEQAGEVLALTAEIIAALSPRDATGDDVLRDMVTALECEIDQEVDRDA